MFRRAIVSLMILAVAACGDSTGPSVPIDSLELSPAELFIGVGDTARIQPKGTTSSGDPVKPGNLTWKSLDQSVAKVSSSGVVTGVAKGSTRIVATGSGAADTAEVTVMQTSFNVQAEDGKACSDPDMRQGRVVAIGEHSIVVADTKNPAGGFTDREYQEFADLFDDLIHPTVAGYFGKPEDIDGNGRVIIFFTRAVNEMTPPGSNSYVGGFFFSRDLFPTKGVNGCATSNEAEMFYMLVPDPNGEVNGNVRTKEFVARVTPGVIAHEFQHLINASRRIFVNGASSYEEVWLNEGLSHIAEELVFYRVTGLVPEQNLDLDQIRRSNATVDAFNEYVLSNFGRLGEFYRDPKGSTGYAGDRDVDLATRGAAWSFLRYAADRSNLTENRIWNDLSNATLTGFANLQKVLGTDPMSWYRDWIVAALVDDAVLTNPLYQLRSWDYRSFTSAVSLPLPTPHIITNGSTATLSIRGGGADYVRFAVPSGGLGELHVTPAGVTPTQGQCQGMPPIVMAVGGVITLDGGSPGVLCLVGDAGGAEFALIPANLSKVPSAFVAVNVTGYGIVGQPSGTTVVPGPAESPVSAALAAPVESSFELALRQREIAELTPLLGGSPEMRLASVAQAAPSPSFNDIHVSVVRMR